MDKAADDGVCELDNIISLLYTIVRHTLSHRWTLAPTRSAPDSTCGRGELLMPKDSGRCPDVAPSRTFGANAQLVCFGGQSGRTPARSLRSESDRCCRKRT